MSKKRQRAHASTQTGPQAPAAAASKRGLLAIVGVVIAAGVVLAGAAYIRAGRHIDFPAPVPPKRDLTVTHADFVGAVACASCHPSEYASWKGSTHGRAGAGPPNPQSVKGPFDGRPMRFRDAVVTPSMTASGAFVFTVVQENRPEVVFRVDAVVGGGYMAGGGT